MTRRTRSTAGFDRRLSSLETATEENAVGWFDLMDYSIRDADAENPPSPEEVFGDGWTYPDASWVENMRAARNAGSPEDGL